jgi:hypothetical protein
METMITLFHGEEATLLCDDTEVVSFPYLKGILPKYSYNSVLAYHSVLDAIPNTESISLQGVYLPSSEEFIPFTIWVLAKDHAGYLPSETAGRILRAAGFPQAILPGSSAQRTAPDRHRQNPQTTRATSLPPEPSLQE